MRQLRLLPRPRRRRPPTGRTLHARAAPSPPPVTGTAAARTTQRGPVAQLPPRLLREATHAARATATVVGEATATAPTAPNPPLRVRVHVVHPPFPAGVPRPQTVQDAPPPPVVQAVEGPQTGHVHAVGEPPRPVRGGPRVVGQTIGPGGSLKEAAPPPGRPPPLLPGVAVRPKATRTPAHGEEARTARQPLVLAEAPRVVRVGVPVAPLHGFALQCLGFGTEPLPAQRQGGRPRVRGPPRPPLPTGATAAAPLDPIGLREHTRRGHGLPLPGRVLDAPPPGEVPRAAAITTKGTPAVGDRLPCRLPLATDRCEGCSGPCASGCGGSP